MTKDTFKNIYDTHFDAIRNYVYYRSKNTELSTDITQEVFVKLWEKQLEIPESEAKSLLYKMAGDLFVSHTRKVSVAQKYQSSISLKVNNQDPNKELEFKELKERYEQGLNEMPEGQRTVFLMSRMEDLKYKEIADRLDISVKAVEKRMSKALSGLKSLLLGRNG